MRRWREEAGLSCYRLARQAGLHPKTVQRLEEGEDAKVSTWLKALRVLHRRPEELWADLELPYEEEEERPKELGETERRILECLRLSGGELTAPVPRLAERVGRSKRETWKGLKELLEQGRIVKLVKRRGRGRGNTYALAEAEKGRSHDGGDK